MSHPSIPQQGVTLTHARLMACSDAVSEIDALARMLPAQVTPDATGEHLIIRGIAARMLTLASVLLAGLNEEESEVPTATLERRVLTHPDNQRWV